MLLRRTSIYFPVLLFPSEIYSFPNSTTPKHIPSLVFPFLCALLRSRHFQWHSNHARICMQRNKTKQNNRKEFQQLQQNHFN